MLHTSCPSDPPTVRAAHPEELASLSWWSTLQSVEQEQVAAHLEVLSLASGSAACQAGTTAAHWLGLLDGLLSLSSPALPGLASGLANGAWWGEPELLRHGTYRDNATALRPCLLARLPAPHFEALLRQSLAFSHHVLGQLNQQLSHERDIRQQERERSLGPDRRVALCLAELFDPLRCPGVGSLLRITQQELAQLAGLSRQRVNQALQQLQQTEVLRIEYGGLRVLDRTRLH
ncbi:CRP-like cAMP-binding protein [Inhella inkyongensis]|uniref:CRP-like cAMP-binding protein n=1 Tax=Inhella inkyongensis TaxID=392593 RepID=A0A840S701_9BURK|nr:Crp/Fnr family transcriptional regulator [Inhella inkyongensis]MBB5204564.1 CRP-like cAMP-binding protein [Inhella inkyongensis]